MSGSKLGKVHTPSKLNKIFTHLFRYFFAYFAPFSQAICEKVWALKHA